MFFGRSSTAMSETSVPDCVPAMSWVDDADVRNSRMERWILSLQVFEGPLGGSKVFRRKRGRGLVLLMSDYLPTICLPTDIHIRIGA